MTESDSKYDKESNNGSKEPKSPCSGLHCKNVGKIKLTIKFTHRSGFFCTKCFEYLQENDLIDLSLDNNENDWKLEVV